MSYYEKVYDYIFHNNIDGLFQWLVQQPLLDQPDIMRTFNTVLQQLADEKGVEIPPQNLAKINANANELEENILDEKLIKLKLDMAIEERDKHLNKINDTIIKVRKYIQECITTNAPNASSMIELAHKIIQSEKQNNLYDANNWYFLPKASE